MITSTGTGSGKSLTYLVPIVDHVLKNQPERHSVRALVVYPMNALINSQLEALELQQAELAGVPVRFKHYTGQVRDEARNAIMDDPPHILLTNYVMLEYMLIRPAERTLIGLTTRELAFLVVDELHFYQGRQGRTSRCCCAGYGSAPGGAIRSASAPRRRSSPTATAPSARRGSPRPGASCSGSRSRRTTWSRRRCSGSPPCRCRRGARRSPQPFAPNRRHRSAKR